jgi:hypothetical protein
MDALRRCIEVLPPQNDWVSNTRLWLVTANKINDWTTEPTRATASLSGSGYVYVFTDFDETPRRTAGVTRNHYLVRTTFECQISDEIVAYKRDTGPWKVSSLPRLDARRDDRKLSRKNARQV